MKSIIFLTLFFLAFPSLAKKHTFLPSAFEAEFEQVYKSSLRGKIKKSKCKMDYKYPERIKFTTQAPSAITYVSNPFKTWYYVAPEIKGVPGELMVTPTSKNNPYSRFFDSLKNGIKTNTLYKVKNTKEGDLLTFSEAASKDVGVKSALLNFKGKKNFLNIDTIIITYLRGNSVTLDFNKIKLKKSFSPHHFTFVPPKNTRVNK